jgi:hypothetical protein
MNQRRVGWIGLSSKYLVGGRGGNFGSISTNLMHFEPLLKKVLRYSFGKCLLIASSTEYSSFIVVSDAFL